MGKCGSRTWGPSGLVSAQLSAAVGAAGVHAPIVQQEQGVGVAAGHLLQAAAGEDAAGSRLADRALAVAHAQLAVRRAAPAPQHLRAAPPHATGGRRLGSLPHGTLRGRGRGGESSIALLSFLFTWLEIPPVSTAGQVCQVFCRASPR